MTHSPQKQTRNHGTLMPLNKLRSMSQEELLALGMEDIAYVRPVEVDGRTALAICAANGIQIALAPDLGTALEAAWENGLATVTVH